MFKKNQFLAAARLETFMFDNVPMDKIGLKDTRLSNLEYLGNDMIESGNEFGPATPYGERKKRTLSPLMMVFLSPTCFSLVGGNARLLFFVDYFLLFIPIV